MSTIMSEKKAKGKRGKILLPTKISIIPVEGDIIEREVDLPRSVSYSVTRKITDEYLGDSYLERYLITWNDEKCEMFLDEDGKPKGRPLNVRASRIIQVNFDQGLIVRPAVIFHRKIWY